MNYKDAALFSENELVEKLSTSRAGLSSQEASSRLRTYGTNSLRENRHSGLRIFVRQFQSPFVYVLLATMGLAFILKETIDAYTILIFIIINTVLGFLQEFRSDQAVHLLSTYLTTNAKVIRDGEERTIVSNELVPGDIAILAVGDIVPADIRIIESFGLAVDESSLTGESNTVDKTPKQLRGTLHEMHEAKNICFSGTTVTAGKATGVISATGRDSAMGIIASLSASISHKSGFEKDVSDLSRTILGIVIITIGILFFINLFLRVTQENAERNILFLIALAVSAIPEALPMVMTFSLSRGALRLAKRHVVVKRLSAIEDLGSIEVLCVDKTGTITENVMTVDESYPGTDDQTFLYARLAVPSLPGENVHTSFDAALVTYCNERKVLEHHEGIQQREVYPFDPLKKCNFAIAQNHEIYELVMRGAPEVILASSKNVPHGEYESMQHFIATEGDQGRRILAVAKKEIHDAHISVYKETHDLECIGLISFYDPIKSTAFAAIENAKSLGVQIKILTGDGRDVAGNVAKRLNLIPRQSDVITGSEFDALSPDRQEQAVFEHTVFARVSPEEKHKIIQILTKRYRVGFLGEGINDTPALKAANVALVVDQASQVAREASDIVLLSKSLSVIIDGIREGRIVFTNTLKYLKATLSSNFGNFFTVAIASLLVPYLPMLPIQILLLNLLTDSPMILVVSDTVSEGDIGKPMRFDMKEIVSLGLVLGVVSTVFDFLYFVIFSRGSPQILQTNWFIGSVLTEVLFLYSVRTRLPFYKVRMPPLSISLITLLAVASAVILPFTSAGGQTFGFVRPTWYHVLLTISIAFVYFAATEGAKLLYYRKMDTPSTKPVKL